MGERFSWVRVTTITPIFARSCTYKRNDFTWAIRNFPSSGCYTKPFGFCNPRDEGGLVRVYAVLAVGEPGVNVEDHRAA